MGFISYYIIFAFITGVLYCSLMMIDSFIAYMYDLMEDLITNPLYKERNILISPSDAILAVGVLLTIFSGIGLILTIGLIFDFFTTK